jgi:hypothetical protein
VFELLIWFVVTKAFGFTVMKFFAQILSLWVDGWAEEWVGVEMGGWVDGGRG